MRSYDPYSYDPYSYDPYSYDPYSTTSCLTYDDRDPSPHTHNRSSGSHILAQDCKMQITHGTVQFASKAPQPNKHREGD